VSIVLVPLATELGAALIRTLGRGELTDTMADCVAFPPGPVHVNEYVESAATAPVDCEPLSPLEPLQPPDALQEVALLLDQVSEEGAPESTVLGVAASVTTGAKLETVTVADCVADPLAPVQVSSYSVVLVRVPVDQVPLVATLPCQPPDAVQAVAPTDFQLSVEFPPLLTVVGVAVSVTATEALAGAPTTTSTDCAAVPPEPVQASVKLVPPVRGGVVIVPAVGTVPLQPPEAVQL
jgi:hypothetical protein